MGDLRSAFKNPLKDSFGETIVTVIIKEKAVFVYTGKQWLNLAQAQSITLSEERAIITWVGGKFQGFSREESQQIIKALEELRK